MTAQADKPTQGQELVAEIAHSLEREAKSNGAFEECTGARVETQRPQPLLQQQLFALRWIAQDVGLNAEAEKVDRVAVAAPRSKRVDADDARVVLSAPVKPRGPHAARWILGESKGPSLRRYVRAPA